MADKRRIRQPVERDKWACLFEYWMGVQGRLSWEYVAEHADCNRGFYGKPLCRVCPYQDGC